MGNYSPSPSAAAASGQASGQIPRPMVFHAMPFDGPQAAYLGPRKTTDSPQATFNYGDGTYVMLFHYTKDGKAAERGCNTSSAGHVEDKKEPTKNEPIPGTDASESVAPTDDAYTVVSPDPPAVDNGYINSTLIAKELGLTGFTLSPGTNNNTFHNNDDAKKSADSHVSSNASAAAAAKKEKATMAIRGYPLLKGKTTVEVTGVGAGSGVWYCKTVVQQWHVQHGYVTDLQLTRGEGGGGDKGGNNQAAAGSAPPGGLPK